MKKKVVWLVVTFWMVSALLLTSCAPTVVKEEEKVAPPVKEKEEVVVPKEVVVPEKEANMVKWRGTKVDGTVVEKMLEKPRYGGIHATTAQGQPLHYDYFDNSRTPGSGTTMLDSSVNEGLTDYDWSRGPAGTGEWLGNQATPAPPEWDTGWIAESWEMLDAETVVYHIRRGVRFVLDPTREASLLVGGRELTANDVVYSLRRQWKMGYASTQPAYRDNIGDPKNPDNSIYVSPTDKWAVVFKVQPGQFGIYHRHFIDGWTKTFAPEVLEKYGRLTDWRQFVGTGPFILKEYVGASSITFVRNPNYWGHDPLFPENQLPYLDGYKVLIIPDLSTQLAALRTGQIDNLPTGGVTGAPQFSADEARSLMKTNPQLEWIRYISNSGTKINMRTDTKPFDDIRVRRALAMAVNRQPIIDYYYDGDALLFNWPVYPAPLWAPFYVPLEKYPESVRELYEYHPDKAKQLLAEAGYPNGFKTEIITLAENVDLLSIVKEDWAKIGVDLKIDVRDRSVYSTMLARKTHTQMIMSESVAGPNLLWTGDIRKFGGQNYSIIDTPWWDVVYYKMVAKYFEPGTHGGFTVMHEPMAEGMPSWAVYTNEQAWWVNMPNPALYSFWQPWLKNYYGIGTSSRGVSLGWTRVAWIDQELKKAMGR